MAIVLWLPQSFYDRNLRKAQFEFGRKLWKNNNKEFDAKPLLENWESIKNKAVTPFEDLIIRAYAVNNSVLDAADNIKHGLRIEDIEIDNNEFQNVLKRLLRLKMTRILLNQLKFSKQDKKKVILQTVKKEFGPFNSIKELNNWAKQKN